MRSPCWSARPRPGFSRRARAVRGAHSRRSRGPALDAARAPPRRRRRRAPHGGGQRADRRRAGGVLPVAVAQRLGRRRERLAHAACSIPRTRSGALGAALAGTLLDFGARGAAVDSARAGYDATVADYRDTVLEAFHDVEDQLANVHWLGEASVVQEQAARAARETLALTLNQYKAGTVSFLNVATAQATQLSEERSTVQLLGRRLAATVSLIRADRRRLAAIKWVTPHCSGRPFWRFALARTQVRNCERSVPLVRGLRRDEVVGVVRRHRRIEGNREPPGLHVGAAPAAAAPGPRPCRRPPPRWRASRR